MREYDAHDAQGIVQLGAVLYGVVYRMTMHDMTYGMFFVLNTTSPHEKCSDSLYYEIT